MKTRSKLPPNPWFHALAAAALAPLGIPAGTRVVVRESRSGGWRILSKTHHVVVGTRGIGRMVHFAHGEGDALLRADQSLAEAHFQSLLRREMFEGVAA